MISNRCFKIPGVPRVAEVLIILFVIFAPIGYLLYGAWGQLYVRTIPFKDVQEMNKFCVYVQKIK